MLPGWSPTGSIVTDGVEVLPSISIAERASAPELLFGPMLRRKPSSVVEVTVLSQESGTVMVVSPTVMVRLRLALLVSTTDDNAAPFCRKVVVMVPGLSEVEEYSEL